MRKGSQIVYKSLKDILEPEVYHDILEDIFGEDFLREYERWIESGFVQGQRQTIMNFLQVQFPEITSLANQQINSINDPEVLNAMSLRLFATQTAEEAKQILLEVNKQ